MITSDRKQRRLYLLAITVDKRARRTSQRMPKDASLDYMSTFNVPTGEDDATQARLDQNAALRG